MEKKVSIMIPFRDCWQLTSQCIRAVVFNTEYKNYELIIMNNDSTDEIEVKLTPYVQNFIDLGLLKSAKIIKNKTNESFSACNNQGRENATGHYLCLLNNDTIVTKGWLTNMIKVFKEEDRVGVVGARLVYPGSGEIQHAGVVFEENGTVDHEYHRKDQSDSLVMDREQYPAVTGACLLIPTSLYDKVGKLDERYRWGWEDIDLCNKIRVLGYKVFYEPTARVYHYGSQTSGRYDFENANFNLYVREWIANEKYKHETDTQNTSQDSD